MIEHVFTGCGIQINEMAGPDGEVVMRAIVIIDPQSGQTFNFPMQTEEAKGVGQKLMGIGKVQLANASDMANLNGRKN